MSTLTIEQIVVFIIPPFLILSTYSVFTALKKRYPSHRAYIYGFLFYWIFWCCLPSLIVLDSIGLRQLFSLSPQPLGEPPFIGLISLLLPVLVAPFFTRIWQQWRSLDTKLLMLSLLFAIVNGTLEEILWRGTFVSLFPDNLILGYLYPAVAFGLWHLAPQVIFPAEDGALAFAISAILLGLAFGWVAYNTGSILLPVISHILLDWAGLPGLSIVDKNMRNV